MRAMRHYIDTVAPKYELPPDLVAAIVSVESSGDRFAIRVEPGYRWLWDVKRNRPFRVTAAVAKLRVAPENFPATSGMSRNTEWIGQQTSWGLMQVMGAVARGQGFKGHFPALCDPLEGLHAGCRHLARLRDQHFDQAGWAGVVDAYNDGNPRIESPKDYPHKVAAAGASHLLVLPA